jgi:hypothetical protein
MGRAPSAGALKGALDLFETACSVPVNRTLVDREILETLEDYDRRVRGLSQQEMNWLREGTMKIASLVYMTYSLADPDRFACLLRCCTPAPVGSLADRFHSLGWLLEHRMIHHARGCLRPGNLLRFNLNQSRLFEWHNRPPVAPRGVGVIAADPVIRN